MKGYELLPLALLTVRNLVPLDFGFHFSKKAPAGARQAQPRRPRGYVARHLRVAGEMTKVELALQLVARALAQGVKALYVLVDAWFTSPKFCQAMRELGLHVIGRLSRDHTRFLVAGEWCTLDELYQRHKHLLVKDPELGLLLARVPVTCGNGLHAAIVLSKGFQEPEPEGRPQDRKKAKPAWTVYRIRFSGHKFFLSCPGQ